MANGSVYKYDTKAGERWRIVYDIAPHPETGKRRQRQQRGFERRKDAEKVLREVLTSVDENTHVERKNERITEFVRDVWLPHIKTQVRETTYAIYERDCRNHVIPGIGGVKVQALTPDHLLRFYRELSVDKGLAPKTIANIHGMLYGIVKHAVGTKRLATNPLDSDAVKPPRDEQQPEDKMTTWSGEQLRRFLANLRKHDDRLYAMWLLYITTGMRRGEVLGLRWSDIDLDASALRVHQNLTVVDGEPFIGKPKTAKSKRAIRLDPETVAALREHRSRQATERLACGPAWDHSNDLVFTHADGRMLHPARVSKWFSHRAKRAGLPRIRLHDLRHSYATAALKAGVPMKVVSDRLGHANIAITSDLYTHVDAATDQQAANEVASAILG